jgi:hypothetical protein
MNSPENVKNIKIVNMSVGYNLLGIPGEHLATQNQPW